MVLNTRPPREDRKSLSGMNMPSVREIMPCKYLFVENIVLKTQTSPKAVFLGMIFISFFIAVRLDLKLALRFLNVQNAGQSFWEVSPVFPLATKYNHHIERICQKGSYTLHYRRYFLFAEGSENRPPSVGKHSCPNTSCVTQFTISPEWG